MKVMRAIVEWMASFHSVLEEAHTALRFVKDIVIYARSEAEPKTLS